jgi:hypothetical protein
MLRQICSKIVLKQPGSNGDILSFQYHFRFALNSGHSGRKTSTSGMSQNWKFGPDYDLMDFLIARG